MNLRNDNRTVYDDQTATFRSDVPMDSGQTDYKRSLAYRHLRIDPKDVQYIPFLATQLRRIARTVRCVDTDNPDAPPFRPLDYLRFSEDPEARKVLEVYYSVPESYRRLLRPEDFCHAAGVSPWQVLDTITLVAVRLGAMGSAVVAAIVQPSVVQKTADLALEDDGDLVACRTLLRATGCLTAQR